MEDKSTYFVYNGEKIKISTDLYPIIKFLQEIEKEIDVLLGFENKLGSIKKNSEKFLN